MERKREQETSQDRIVASFSNSQLESLQDWLKRNVDLSPGSNFVKNFARAITEIALDENGKEMNNESRERIRRGMRVFSALRKHDQDISRVLGGVYILRIKPNEETMEILWMDRKGYFFSTQY